jgi:hypothetical protein
MGHRAVSAEVKARVAAGIAAAGTLVAPTVVNGQEAAGIAPRLPVREVTVFKDGHAFVVQQGRTPVRNGSVVLDQLPSPVLGTFWAYSAENGVAVRAVTARRNKVVKNRPAYTIAELLKANIGAPVSVSERGDGSQPYPATILSVPEPEAADPDTPAPAARPYSSTLASYGSLVLLKTAEGIRPVPINRIYGLSLPENAKTGATDTEMRNELELRVDGRASGQADIGFMYLQRGLRWIPHYKLDLDGKGSAQVSLQATLLNELIDLDNVNLNLVVGVPTFAFKQTPDPIGLQDTIARLSMYFTPESQTGAFFSNSIMGQSARMGERIQPRPAEQSAPLPELTGAEANEDLYLFAVKGVTLKKNERMTLPVAQGRIGYADVYQLELPPVLPRELVNYDSGANAEYARLLASPRVKHVLRLKNTGMHPLTTAPALLMKDGRPLAQGMMTYTSVGSTSDLPLTDAVDVAVKRTDTETKRTPNAVTINRVVYTQVDLTGTITLTNYRKEPVTVEATRFVFGQMLSASNNGKAEQVNADSDPTFPIGPNMAYALPGDLGRFNGLGRATWSVMVPPGKSVTLTYTWQYLVR